MAVPDVVGTQITGAQQWCEMDCIQAVSLDRFPPLTLFAAGVLVMAQAESVVYRNGFRQQDA